MFCLEMSANEQLLEHDLEQMDVEALVDEVSLRGFGRATSERNAHAQVGRTRGNAVRVKQLEAENSNLAGQLRMAQLNIQHLQRGQENRASVADNLLVASLRGALRHDQQISQCANAFYSRA